MDKLAFIYLFPIVLCAFCGIAVFLIGMKYPVNRIMAYAYGCASMAMLFARSYDMEVTEWSWLFDCIAEFTTLAAYAAMFLYLRGLTNIKGIRKKDFVIFLAPLFITLGSLGCYIVMMAEGGIQGTMDYLNAVNGLGYIPQGSPFVYYVKRTFGSYLYRIFALGEVAFLVTYSFFSLREFNKTLHEYYTTVDNKTRRGSSIITFGMIAISVGTVIFASHPYEDSIVYRIIITSSTTLIGVASLLLLLHALSHKYAINSLREQIAEAELREKEQANNDALIGSTGAMDRMRADMKELVEKKFYLDQSLTLISLSQMLGSNRTYVSNFIHTEFEMSFSDFINKMRVDYIIDQVKTNGKDVSTSSLIEEAGFSSMPSFYRNFKKFTGYSPAKYFETV